MILINVKIDFNTQLNQYEEVIIYLYENVASMLNRRFY